MPNLVNQILFSELQSDFQNMGSCIVVDVGAVNPEQDIEIRTQLRQAGVRYRVVRSRLAKKAFDEIGLDMSEALKGRCGIAVAEEEGAIGAANHHVCLFTPAAHFDWMGYRIRAEGWSFVVFVEWDGARLAPRWDRVQSSELYQHDADDETDFDGPYSEASNLMARPLAPAAAADFQKRELLESR